MSKNNEYVVSIINAAIVNIGEQAVLTIKDNITDNTDINTYISEISVLPHTELIIQLLDALNDEGKYLVLSSMVNHLRYPNPHTHFFSQTLLNIFYVILSIYTSLFQFSQLL